MSQLSPTQLLTLKTAINANPTWAAFPTNDDGYLDLAAVLNGVAAPAFVVWRTNVTTREIGEAMNSSEVAGLTTANTNRLQVMEAYSGGTFNASRADTRAGFDGVFSGAGGVNTRAALLATYKRNASYAEKIFATGTGSDASPATMGYEEKLTAMDIQLARTS